MSSTEIGVIGAIIVSATILVGGYFVYSVLNFFIAVPKQLKRIADALEKEDYNG